MIYEILVDIRSELFIIELFRCLIYFIPWNYRPKRIRRRDVRRDFRARKMLRYSLEERLLKEERESHLTLFWASSGGGGG